MKQLDLFGGFPETAKSKVKTRNQGRPKTITPEIVFETKKLLSSKKKISSDEIMQIMSISKSTFYRIKKGYYDDLFKKYLESNIKNFSLTQENA